MKTFKVIQGGIVFELQPETEGGYTITVPSLPGCISYGETFEKAVDMIKDAMEGWLAVAREKDMPIPEQFESIELAAFWKLALTNWRRKALGKGRVANIAKMGIQLTL